jgi:hypothetical protein
MTCSLGLDPALFGLGRWDGLLSICKLLAHGYFTTNLDAHKRVEELAVLYHER